MTKVCASCLKDLTYAREDGISSLYSPRTYILCIVCFWSEANLIEQKSTNNIPEEVQRYKENLKEVGIF